MKSKKAPIYIDYKNVEMNVQKAGKSPFAGLRCQWTSPGQDRLACLSTKIIFAWLALTYNFKDYKTVFIKSELVNYQKGVLQTM